MSLADFLTIFVNILDISRNSKNINIFKLGSLCAPQNFNEFQKSNWIIHKNSWYPIILNIFFLLAFLIIPKLCIVTKVVFVKQKKNNDMNSWNVQKRKTMYCYEKRTV